MTAQGLAHGDLSTYNLLWWDDRLWFIDFSRAVDIAANPQGVAHLHSDAVKIAKWFRNKGLDMSGDELFTNLLSRL